MNVRQVSKKIKSVTNVKKITNAMQLVSAVKMRKAQLAAIEGRPYQQFIEQAIRRISGKLEKNLSTLLSVQTQSKKKLVILITSNKGLCGSFNSNVLRRLIGEVDMKQTDFITIGKKGVTLLSQVKAPIIADFSSNIPLNSVSAASDLMLERYLKEDYAEVLLFYNKFVSTLRSDSTVEPLLPLKLGSEEGLDKIEEEINYTIEPDAELIIEQLLRNFIEEKIRFSVMQSEAGEHSARMIAMKNATDNATEVVLNLASLRNKLRQQKITYELLDMITAKESVEIN